MDFSTLPGLLGMLLPMLPTAAPMYVFGALAVAYLAHKLFTNMVFVAAIGLAIVAAYMYYFKQDSLSTAKVAEVVDKYQKAFYADNNEFITSTTTRLQKIRDDLRS